MKSPSKKSISFCLLALFAWSSLFGAGDGLLMCLHSEGSSHVGESEQEDCCHSESADSTEFHVDDECDDCTDVELNVSEVTSIRKDSSNGISVSLVMISSSLMETDGKSLLNLLSAKIRLRAPPGLTAKSVAIARQLVLRL